MSEGRGNTGTRNTGNWNVGNRNTGNWNTGNWNTGYYNTGNWNTGNRNTSNSNTGNWNTGNWNTGNRNTGNWNTGNWNTGYWNTGNYNTGYLNTGDGRVEVFGRPCDVPRHEIDWPDFFFHKTASVWVPLSSMSEDERKKYSKTCEVVGGYLKKVDPKAGWRAAWDNASDDDRRKCLDLPNWDNEMFLEITGIDVEAELAAGAAEEMTVADIERALGKRIKIVKEVGDE